MNQKIDQYKSIEVKTSSPLKLVIILYDLAIKQLEESVDKMDYRTYDVVNRNLKKTSEIIAELQSSLNMEQGGAVSKNLNDIYHYLNQKIYQGNIEKDTAPLKEVIQILKKLRESWKQISQNNPDQNQGKNYLGGISIKG